MFSPEEKSSFKYYLAHLCAYNMTALNLGCWKPKYLLHDIEKPWLKLWWGKYEKVRAWHRRNNKHHLEYKNPEKIDWEALVIDWECSHFTKMDGQETARELYDYSITAKVENGEVSQDMAELMKLHIPPILEKLKL